MRAISDRKETLFPLPLAGEGQGGGISASRIAERAPTRIASSMRYDLPRKRER
ncbi:hypothetical protein ACVWW1_007101 [Bradyrhizobium sp. JR3.5]